MPRAAQPEVERMNALYIKAAEGRRQFRQSYKELRAVTLNFIAAWKNHGSESSLHSWNEGMKAAVADAEAALNRAALEPK